MLRTHQFSWIQDIREKRQTDAADTCHYPSSGVVVKYHLHDSLIAASGSKYGNAKSGMRCWLILRYQMSYGHGRGFQVTKIRDTFMLME